MLFWGGKKKIISGQGKEGKRTRVKSWSCHENPFWYLLFILFLCYFSQFVFLFRVGIEMCRRKLSVRVAIGVAQSIGLDTAWTVWAQMLRSVRSRSDEYDENEREYAGLIFFSISVVFLIIFSWAFHLFFSYLSFSHVQHFSRCFALYSFSCHSFLWW